MKKKHKILIILAYSLLMGSLVFLTVFFSPSLTVMLPKLILILLVSYPASRFYLRKVSKDRELLIEKIYYDRQTGLPNREKLRLDIAKDGSVLYLINIDSFKEVNDFYGNGMGDAVLESLAKRLKSLALSSYSRLFEDVRLYKLEVDEFAFLFTGSLEQDRVQRTADIIIEMVNDYPFQVNKSDITITITIGLAVSGDLESNGTKGPGMLAQADMALKRAKEKRVPFLMYHHSMNIPREYEENIRWTHEVKQSIREDRVVPYFQPIWNNRTGSLEKFECLMRIIDDKGNVIYPDTFLKISKRSRQYPSLSRIMLRKIIREMKHTTSEYSFNISVEDIQNRDTVLFIRRILENHWKEAPRLYSRSWRVIILWVFPKSLSLSGSSRTTAAALPWMISVRDTAISTTL